jgi:hypothetical protein
MGLYKILKSASEGVKNQNRRRAYHGSPHDFDEFSSEKIGTGEGAQAKGRGLYFSDSEEVAKGYRDALTPRNEGYESYLLEEMNRAMRSEDYLRADLLERALLHQTPKDFRDMSADPDYDDTYREMAKEFADEIESMNVNFGRVYTVEIPDESSMLDWDLSGREQPDQVKKILRDAGIYNDEMGGMDIYYRSVPRETPVLEAQEKATKRLKDIGISGIKYKGMESGETNFVVFDEGTIKVIDKYGVPLAVGTGAAAVVEKETGTQ